MWSKVSLFGVFFFLGYSPDLASLVCSCVRHDGIQTRVALGAHSCARARVCACVCVVLFGCRIRMLSLWFPPLVQKHAQEVD